jgi:hypothetical protein
VASRDLVGAIGQFALPRHCEHRRSPFLNGPSRTMRVCRQCRYTAGSGTAVSFDRNRWGQPGAQRLGLGLCSAQRFAGVAFRILASGGPQGWPRQRAVAQRPSAPRELRRGIPVFVGAIFASAKMPGPWVTLAAILWPTCGGTVARWSAPVRDAHKTRLPNEPFEKVVQPFICHHRAASGCGDRKRSRSNTQRVRACERTPLRPLSPSYSRG